MDVGNDPAFGVRSRTSARWLVIWVRELPACFRQPYFRDGRLWNYEIIAVRTREHRRIRASPPAQQTITVALQNGIALIFPAQRHVF